MMQFLKKAKIFNALSGLCSKRAFAQQKWIYSEKKELFHIEFVNAFEDVESESKCPFAVLDVRTPDEISIADIPAKNRKGVSIPKYNVEVQYLLRDPNSYFELPKDKYIICMCHHGVRSATAAFHLRNRGYKSVNLKGGIDAVSDIWDDIEKY